MSSTTYHESLDLLGEDTKDMHRAIVSLMEELEAIDWYQQRVDATTDVSLKEVLAHNMREEIEHAMMNLEWIRRKHPKFDENARTYLFTEGPITAVEKGVKASASEVGGSSSHGGSGATATSATTAGTLGIGSLKTSKAG